MRSPRRPFLAVPTALAASALAAGLVLSVPPSTAAAAVSSSGKQIAALALANVGKQACSTNSLGGKAFDSSCTGNGGQPEYWCADFARWVWQHNGVEDTAWLTAAAGSFYTYGLQYGTLTATPAVGDAAVFNYAGGGSAEHVAIVTAVKANGQIVTASGDWGGQSGSEAKFASTSSVVLNSPSYVGAVGSWPGTMGMTLSGFVAPVGALVHPVSGRTLLGSTGTLSGTTVLESPNGIFSLGLTPTGQLVEIAGGRTVWTPQATSTSGTSGSPGVAGDELVMQTDGDLVLETPPATAGGTPTIYWTSQTGGHTTGTFHLAIFDNGRVAVLADGRPLWSATPVTNVLANNTVLPKGQALISANGLYVLYMQRDGNVVEYTAGLALWWTDTANHPGARLMLRQNGRLVVIGAGGKVLWSSRVAGGDGTAVASLNNDSSLSVLAGTKVLWTSATSGAWASLRAPAEALSPPPREAS